MITAVVPSGATLEANFAATFAVKAVACVGVIRGSIVWVDGRIGRDRLIAEVGRRGFQMIQCGAQYVAI